MRTKRAYIQEESIDYKKAKANYLAIQANPSLAENEKEVKECECLIHRKRKNVKGPSHSPWVGDNWFRHEWDDSETVTQKYESTTIQMANVLKVEE